MVKWVEEEDGAEKVDSEVMFRFLGKTPGWGEKNFQVSSCAKTITFRTEACGIGVGKSLSGDGLNGREKSLIC